MGEEFPGQRDGEEVVFVFRKHPVVLAKPILLMIILSVVGFLLYKVVPDSEYSFLFILCGVLAGALILFCKWMGWYFSVYIITNQRIRQNIQKGFFRKSVVDVNLDKIMSANVDIRGILGSLLGYGAIILQTQAGDMHIEKVSAVETVYDKIQERIG